MDTKAQPIAADRVYEDFEPFFEWAKDEGSATLIVILPGYRRDQMRLQVTSAPILKIMGERYITGNRWRRFNKEFPIPSDYDTDNVSAKFEGSRLIVKFPKLIKPKEETTIPPPEEAPRPEPEAPPREVDQQKDDAQEVTPKAQEDKAEARTDEVSEKTLQEEKEKEKVTPKAQEDKAEARTDEVSEKTQQEEKEKEKVTPKVQEDKAEARTDEVSEKTPQEKEKEEEKEKEPRDEKEKSKTETEASSTDKVAQEKKVRTNGLTETTEAATSKAAETKDAKTVTRSKTRFLDFTLSLGPGNRDYDDEALGDLDAGLNKWKKLVKWVVLVLLVVGLGLLRVRNALRASSPGEPEFQEL